MLIFALMRVAECVDFLSGFVCRTTVVAVVVVAAVVDEGVAVGHSYTAKKGGNLSAWNIYLSMALADNCHHIVVRCFTLL